MRHSTPLAGSLLALASAVFASEAVPAPATAPDGAITVDKQLVSYSIQYEQLPDFAGTPDSPNAFSVNLLKNLGSITGTMPMVRVGGTTQDDTVYHASQTDVPVYNNGKNDPGYQRKTQYIGPGYFDSYKVFPNTTFIAGLNLARQGTNTGDGSNARQSLLDIAQQSCAALGDNLHLLEMGNEPDLFVTYGRRQSGYSASQYVSEWKDAVEDVRAGPCGNQPFFANSFTGAGGAGPKPLDSFNAGQNDGGYIKEVSEHNYMRAASGADLQNDLMSHAAITSKIGGHTSLMGHISSLNLPYTLGECNSLYGGSASSGLSDVMGAALWSIDFTLFAAVSNIRRLHFHQALGNPYNSWAPTGDDSHTMAAYYGNIFTASFVGSESDTSVANIPLKDSNYEAAYAAYAGGKLVRVALVNMRLYRSTDGGDRGTKTYDVQVGDGFTSAKIERLQAAGGDSKTGLTFGGNEYEAGTQGTPAKAANAPANAAETVDVKDGVVSVTVDNSEAVLISLS